MAAHLSHLTTFKRRRAMTRTVIATMFRSYFRRGIDHILLYTRYVVTVILLRTPTRPPTKISLKQVLYENVQHIAEQYPAGPIRDQYTTAAANFRIPYWDWAAVPRDGGSVYPGSVGLSPSIIVNGPIGIQTIANPLYSYRFQPLNPAQLPDPPVCCCLNRFIFC